MKALLALAALSLALAQPARAENWPFWRGPSRQGVSTERGLPLQWSASSNIVWKAEIPGEAWSSPIVHGARVFLTTATGSGVECHVLCLDSKTGAVRWSEKVFEQVPLKKEGRNSYATPTPATDGERVYAVFGDGSIVALDAETGKKVWEHRDVKFYGQHGLGASPVLHAGLLIMAYDGSSSGENKRLGWQIPWEESFLLALDAKTGKVRWKASRGPSRIAHVTPNIMRTDAGEILVSGAGDVVQGFRLEDGKRLWSAFSQGEGVVPSIVIGNGLAFAASGFEKPAVRAVRPPTGEGQPEIVWEQRKGVPMIPSMIFHGEHLFGITEGGIATCLNAATGEIVWQERAGGSHSASPVLIDGKIYFLSEEGETIVIDASPQFKVLARSPLNEKTQASMAVSQGRAFIRTAKSLYCIGQK